MPYVVTAPKRSLIDIIEGRTKKNWTMIEMKRTADNEFTQLMQAGNYLYMFRWKYDEDNGYGDISMEEMGKCHQK